ncbi:MAG: hypothetical protein ACLR60_18925, partial [Clostridium paraputrificum]
MRYKKHNFKKKRNYNSLADIIIYPFGVLAIFFVLIKFFPFDNFNINIAILNRLFSYCLILYILFLTILLTLCKFNKKFIYKFKVKDNLNKIIKNNSFFETELRDATNWNGKDIKKETVSWFPQIFYKIDDKYISLKFILDGSKYEDRLIDLESNIANIFKLRTTSEIKLGEVEYRVLIQDMTPIILGSEIEGACIKWATEDLIYFSEDIFWNFRKQPHALITGVTGGGKTYILYWIIRNLLSIGADLKIIDPKMADLDYLKNILDISNVASTKGNSIKILREAAQTINDRNLEFQQRDDYMQGKDYLDYGYNPIFIIFDEVTAFFASCDIKETKEANSYLQEIIMKGRSAGVFVVLTTQRADTDVISGKIRDQLSLRVSMGQLSKDGYIMTFGSEYKDLRITMRGYIKDKPNTGVGYIYIDGALS